MAAVQDPGPNQSFCCHCLRMCRGDSWRVGFRYLQEHLGEDVLLVVPKTEVIKTFHLTEEENGEREPRAETAAPRFLEARNSRSL